MSSFFSFDFLSTALTVATVAAGAFQIFQGFKQAEFIDKQGRDEVAAAQANTELYIAELERQAEEVQAREQSQVSDRIRAAQQELATVSLAAMERGTGLNTLSAMQTQVGFFEDLDISTVRANTADTLGAIEAKKESARQGVLNTMTITENRTESAYLDAKLNIFGTGLQIGATAARDAVSRHYRSNPIS